KEHDFAAITQQVRSLQEQAERIGDVVQPLGSVENQVRANYQLEPVDQRPAQDYQVDELPLATKPSFRPDFIVRNMPERKIVEGSAHRLVALFEKNLQAQPVALEYASDGKAADIVFDLGKADGQDPALRVSPAMLQQAIKRTESRQQNMRPVMKAIETQVGELEFIGLHRDNAIRPQGETTNSIRQKYGVVKEAEQSVVLASGPETKPVAALAGSGNSPGTSPSKTIPSLPIADTRRRNRPIVGVR
ncbi:MAG: hypothetical protein AAF213_00555, partial [Pseudomonadota bacterium]